MVSKVSIGIGGKKIEVSGHNIRVAGGEIYVDGQQISVGGDIRPINVVINGDVGVLETDSGDVTIT